MGQALRSSSAMLAKYTGWVTALGRRAGENKAKWTAEGQGREADAVCRPIKRTFSLNSDNAVVHLVAALDMLHS